MRGSHLAPSGLSRRPAATPACRVLVVGSGLNACAKPRQLGFEIERSEWLPRRAVTRELDIVVLATPPGGGEAVPDMCRTLKATSDALIFVLLPSADDEAMIEALEAGADDCMLAPQNRREVIARMRALIRRRARMVLASRSRHVRFDGYTLDPLRLTLMAHDGRSVRLTTSQYRLLCALLDRPGEVVSREELLVRVHGVDSDIFDRAIDSLVCRLRRRLAEVSADRLIRAWPLAGYRIEVAEVTRSDPSDAASLKGDAT